MDYKDFSANGPASELSARDKRWWLLKGKERAQAIQAVVRNIWEDDSRRQTQYQLCRRLYGNTPLMGITGFSFTRATGQQTGVKDRMTYNIVQSAIDTVTSKIAKNKPRPMFLTSGGDYQLQRKAKKLDKFVTGVFYENDVYALGQDIFRDGCIDGDGVAFVYEENGRICYERVDVAELYVDQMEARYGCPRQIHRVKPIDRDVLIEMFPDKKKAIQNANATKYPAAGTSQNVADQVTVTSSWHLRSGPEATDGVYCITIEGEELHAEEYKRDYFPFPGFKWSKRSHGYWGQSAAEQIQGIQLEVNKLLWVIQRSYQLAGSFKVLIENGAKIVTEHLNNDIGAIVKYTGTPPQYVAPPIIQAEIYPWLQTLKASAYEQLGVSQLSASSKKPDGLDSGKAIRAYNDIESDRFMVVGQNYERFFLDLARITVDMARDIYERDGSYEVGVPGKRFVETIDWKEIDLEDDAYEMQIFPVSSLPNEPAGRLQTIKEYMQAGLVTPRRGRKLLDFPDLEAEEDLANAPEEYLNEILDKIVYDGEYTPPEPYDDLALAHELALEYYARGKMSGVPNRRLELVRRFIDQVGLLQQKAMPPAAPMAVNPGPAGPPQAVPEAPPQSDLLSNIPGAA